METSLPFYIIWICYFQYNEGAGRGRTCVKMASYCKRMLHCWLQQDTGNLREVPTDVPSTAIAGGVCGRKQQSMSLIFYNGWNLTFTFARNNFSEYRLSLVSLSFNLTYDHYPFPDAKNFVNSTGQPHDNVLIFTVLVGLYTHCQESLSGVVKSRKKYFFVFVV